LKYIKRTVTVIDNVASIDVYHNVNNNIDKHLAVEMRIKMSILLITVASLFSSVVSPLLLHPGPINLS